MLFLTDEQRQYLNLDGAPLPLIDDESGRCFMLMPVAFSSSSTGRVLARVPGIRAVGEANQPTEALATLAILLKDVMESL